MIILGEFSFLVVFYIKGELFLNGVIFSFQNSKYTLKLYMPRIKPLASIFLVCLACIA